ncbi:unnamed protein product, partial [Scytosiphon promiscuus]
FERNYLLVLDGGRRTRPLVNCISPSCFGRDICSRLSPLPQHSSHTISSSARKASSPGQRKHKHTHTRQVLLPGELLGWLDAGIENRIAAASIRDICKRRKNDGSRGSSITTIDHHQEKEAYVARGGAGARVSPALTDHRVAPGGTAATAGIKRGRAETSYTAN